ncbi:MAG: Band 7 protein [candidate division WS6 bacterium GW2011_GWF2_39_15]|uniref:Band 7 protein n=1 Tax=candidate division WS6 bacterium GW2011_GWF2_39_15 TaxID=1619100 RepID=A0A0G0MRM9_9BACT|nr:MAG: Band 7 protein [candidate division WS6 bacterium GW2011_GWF2_39_15]
MENQKAKLIIVAGTGIALALILFASTFYTVRYGTIAVVTRFGEIVGGSVKPGLHIKVPFVDQVLVYRTQKIIYETLSTEAYSNSQSEADYQDYAVDTTTKDGQQISVRYTVRFSVNPNKVKEIAEKLGTEQEVVEKIVKTDSRIWARNMPRSYSAIDLYTGNIQEVSEKISEKLAPLFEENGITLDEFGIRSINFQDEYVTTVEQKQIEKERITTEEYIAQQEEFKKKASITRAEGEAAAQKLQQATLSDNLIKKLYIEKWDGKLPTTTTGADSGLILNLNK